MKEWINRNLVLCSFFLWLVGSFMITILIDVFINPFDGAAILLIFTFSYFGIPPLIGTCRGFSYIFGKGFLSYSARIQFRIILLASLLAVLSLGMISFIIVFIAELSIQITCTGAGCAQGGIGVIMYLPVAWCSYGLVWFANYCFIKYDMWPQPIEPYFSYRFVIT